MSVLKWLIKFLVYLASLICLLILIAYVTGYGYLVKGIRLTYLSGYKTANIYDGAGFDKRLVTAGDEVSTLPKSVDFNKIPMPPALVNMLEKTKTASFIVLRKDSVVWENYYLEHGDSTKGNSFSMAKTVTTFLVQKAIEEGIIKDWNVKVVDYLPWLKGAYAKELTLLHLSNMTAGLDWEESYYDPFGITAQAYYSNDIEAVMHKVNVVFKPGESYVYQSGSTQLLGLCLRKALAKDIASYASEKLWIPLGAESNAYWHTDKENGMELTYCCFNAVTRDFARLGQMVLHKGQFYKGKFIDSTFIKKASTPGKAAWYGQSLWLGNTGNTAWQMMHGANGQFIIVVPDLQLVVVRTGFKTIKDPKSKIPLCAQTYADETIKFLGK